MKDIEKRSLYNVRSEYTLCKTNGARLHVDMAHPVILRVTKLKTIGNIIASGEHTWRQRETPNADPEKTPNNQDWREVNSAKSLNAAIQQRISLVTKKKHTKSPVLALEYLITARKEAFFEHGGKTHSRDYFSDALRWLEDKHGKENVVAVNIQHDELTPHMVAYVVPLVMTEAKKRKRSVITGTNPDGSKIRETREYAEPAGIKLSASNYVDGKDKLSQMQSDFAVEVGNKHGLTRGILGSKAKHQTVKSFYGALAQSQKNHGRITAELLSPRKTTRSILGFSERETPEQVAERISAMMKKHYAHSIQLAALSRTEKLRAEALTLSAREKDEQIQLLQKKLGDEIKELEKITGGLTDDQYQEVRKMAFLFRQENDEKKISEEDTEYRNNPNNDCTP